MLSLNSQLARGKISENTWADEFNTALLQGHKDAIRLGRARAGAKPLSDAELDLQARAMKDTENHFLRNYLADVKSGRYTNVDGSLKEAMMNDRSTLYVGRMRGSANKAFADGSPDDAEFDWELGAEKHCADCPRMAALSPFTKDTLFSHPGDGSTECLGNCTCTLVRGDGVRGFGRAGDLWPGQDNLSETMYGPESPRVEVACDIPGNEALKSRDALSEKLYGGEPPIAETVVNVPERDALSEKLYGGDSPPVRVSCQLPLGLSRFFRIRRFAADCDARTRATIDDVFSPEMTAQQVGDLAAAVPGSKVTVSASAGEVMVDSVKGTLDPFSMKGDGIAQQISFKKVDGEVLGHLDLIAIHNEAPGTGTRVMAKMLQNFKGQGINLVDGTCEGGPGDPKWNGYYTWPRLGFNADLPESVVQKLADDGMPGVKDLNDLMLKYPKKGPAWWKNNGFKIRAKFDLRDGSRSWEILNKYLEEKGIIV